MAGANGSVVIFGSTTPSPGVTLNTLIWNLSSGHAVVNLYTANYPAPDEPMGCCNNAEVGGWSWAGMPGNAAFYIPNAGSEQCLAHTPTS